MSSRRERFLAALAVHRLHLEGSSDVRLAEQAELLSSSLLSSSLGSSDEISTKVTQTAQTFRKAQQILESKQRRLLHSVDSLLSDRAHKRDELSRISGDIEGTEDALMEILAQIAGQDSETKGENLANGLQKQLSALQQLCTAREYLSVLAKAEALRTRAVDAEIADQSDEALARLSELVSLFKEVQSLFAEGAHDMQAIKFIESQRIQAFSHLAMSRKDRLSSALQQSGWPPTEVELASAPTSLKQNANTFASDAAVKRRWKELMKLQKQSEKLHLIPCCSARLSARKRTAADTDRPGSDTYQPLLTIQCLLTPLLLRFYYHFDSARSTNRLDKPEWYLTHILNLLRTHAQLFDSIRGPIATLCSNRDNKSFDGIKYDLHAELLHGLLRPLVGKVESSIPLLLENSRLLSHTIMQVVQFDQDVATVLPASESSNVVHLAECLLSDEAVFEAWVQSERDFASDRLEEELDNGMAWIVGEGDEDEGAQGSWRAMIQEGSTATVDLGDDGGLDGDAGGIPIMKTTRSARAVVSLVDGLTVRYRGLPSLTHQLPFILIQLSLLQQYAQRLEKSLDAFESMSSAFTRAIPGAISVGGSPGPDVMQSEGDMVRGLRGLGRLLKACLSAIYVAKHLANLSSKSFYLGIGTQLHSSHEGLQALSQFTQWQEKEEERELDKASLGELVRRGWRGRGTLATSASTLRSRSVQQSSESVKDSSLVDGVASGAMTNVWESSQTRFEAIAQRAQRAMEKLVVSEVFEGNRSYAYRSWDEEDEEEEGDGESVEKEDIPTPSLLPSLAILSSHLTHLIPSLPKVNSNAVYRCIANSLSANIVDRVLLAGGAHRFSERGAVRFRHDVLLGWLGVVDDVATSEASRMGLGGSALGRKPEASWQYLLDASQLLSLPSHGIGKDGSEQVTLLDACHAAFDQQHTPSAWMTIRQKLHIDDRMNLRLVQDVLRRRIDCPR